MRHFFSYDAQGEIIGMHSHSTSTTGAGGWPDGFAFHEEDSDHLHTMALRAEFTKARPDIAGFLPYDCECSPHEGLCDCMSQHRLDHWVDLETKSFVERRTTAFQTATGPATGALSRAPGTKVAVKVGVTGAPDGTVVVLKQHGHVAIMPVDELTVETVGGVTAEIELTAPAQGCSGLVMAMGPKVKPCHLQLRGWA